MLEHTYHGLQRILSLLLGDSLGGVLALAGTSALALAFIL